MKVFIERTKEFVEVSSGVVSDVLKSLKLLPENVLVTKNTVLVTEDELLEETDEVKILSVVSGG